MSKIFVSTKYNRDTVTSINVRDGHITQRQYNNAMRKLGATAGDYLQAAPVGDGVMSVDVIDKTGELIAVIE